MTQEKIVETTFHVRYAETDQMRVAHHVAYIVWFEEGRSAWMRAMGGDYADFEAEGFYLVVSEVQARYLAPALYGRRVTVRSWAEEVRSRTLKFCCDGCIGTFRAEASFLTFFTDDNIAADPVYARELFAAIEPLDIRWYCQMSTTIARHPRLIDAAARAGCLGAFLGIESLSSPNLRSLNKGFNRPDAYPELLARLTDAGILPSVSLIYGLDGDTYDSLMEGIERLRSWNVTVLFLFILTPYPETPLAERLAAEGRITCTDWSRYDGMTPVIRFGSSDQPAIERAYWRSYDRFYSLGQILRRTWRCRRQYLKNFPRNNIALDLYYLLSVRDAVRRRRHPFTLGS